MAQPAKPLTSQTQVAQVASEGLPQDGQRHRSSNNFPSFTIPEGTKSLEWNADPVPGGNALTHLIFDVKQDVRGGSDPTLLTGISPGSTHAVSTKDGTFLSGGAYYIANPRNKQTGEDFGKSFVVTVMSA
jgi:hypothetical protein